MSDKPGAAARILVADDDLNVCQLLTDVFTLEGYVVDVVHDGDAALSAFRRAPYDLVVSDYRMPGVNGPALYDALQTEWPAIARRFVVITGNSDQEDVAAFAARAGVLVVGKPFDVLRLNRIVREQLEDGV